MLRRLGARQPLGNATDSEPDDFLNSALRHSRRELPGCIKRKRRDGALQFFNCFRSTARWPAPGRFQRQRLRNTDGRRKLQLCHLGIRFQGTRQAAVLTNNGLHCSSDECRQFIFEPAAGRRMADVWTHTADLQHLFAFALRWNQLFDDSRHELPCDEWKVDAIYRRWNYSLWRCAV